MKAEKERRRYEGWREGGALRFHPVESRVSSAGMVSSPSAPNERAPEQGCNLCERNHWPVLIGHKHVSAKLGHCCPRTYIKRGASAVLLAGTATFGAAPPTWCGPFSPPLFMWHVAASSLQQSSVGGGGSHWQPDPEWLALAPGRVRVIRSTKKEISTDCLMGQLKARAQTQRNRRPKRGNRLCKHLFWMTVQVHVCDYDFPEASITARQHH